MESDLRVLLNRECDYRMSEETMDRFLGLMTEIQLKDNEPLIRCGKLDTNIYVVKSGIMRHAYLDGLKEAIFAFSTPGTMIISWYSFYRRMPSFLQIESCGTTVVAKIAKSDFDALVEQSPDFARWWMRLLVAQHWCLEMKLDAVNGTTAKERFESLVRNRPEIPERVEARFIASYLGITPSYLSRLKQQFDFEQKKIPD
jgi:CRP-like cAMP-binding protein